MSFPTYAQKVRPTRDGSTAGGNRGDPGTVSFERWATRSASLHVRSMRRGRSLSFLRVSSFQLTHCSCSRSRTTTVSDLAVEHPLELGGGSGQQIKEDTRYTMEVWTTFPWPQEPREEEVAAVAAAAQQLRHVRDTLMKDNSWSLRALYQAAEVPGPHPLKDAQAVLDDAVRQAYGMPADQGANEFLLELNQLVAEDEAEGRKVQGPGLPKGLDARDPRWTSDDCIEPPGS